MGVTLRFKSFKIKKFQSVNKVAGRNRLGAVSAYEGKIMGSKKTEQMGLIEVMDQIIAQLESRLGGLEESMGKEKNRMDPATTEGAANVAGLQKEIDAIESLLSYIRAEKKEALKLLTAAEKTEERERIENILKCAVYIGVMKENLRAEAELKEKYEHNMERLRKNPHKDVFLKLAKDVEKEGAKKMSGRSPTRPFL